MEPPVARSRGRPRKRRKELDENRTDDLISVPEIKKQVVERKSIVLVGRYVMKEVFLGKIVYYYCGLYRINYENGDYEDLNSSEIRGILVNDNDFDGELTQRRIKLDDLLLKTCVNGSDDFDKSSDPNKDVCGVESSESSGLEDEERDEGDADSSIGSCLVPKELDSGSNSETQPLLPPLQLPPSSGTIGVPEPYVSHLFAVYGFLRSFSTRLFLSPFSLDEFVGSLNCYISNTLFDAIHVSLMRALRRHLEVLSSEGSELASKCLRCNDWSMLDMLTWPVFLMQYLAINEYKRGAEWKGFYNEISKGEYYLLPVSRKLIILQSLCDDVLESEELKAEMKMREESEVGMDNDVPDILPADEVPRSVHPRYAKSSAGRDKEAMEIASKSNAEKLSGNSTSGLMKMENEGTDDADVDENGDECCLCGMDGTLLCCDGCPSAYHSRCIGVLKMLIPEGPWYCPECKINMFGPKIAKGTTLRGAEIFGKDLHGQLFLGTCDHLLVLNINGGYCVRYYNQNDIPKVLQELYASMHHRSMYYGICLAVLQFWNIPESVWPLSYIAGTYSNSEDTNEDIQFSSLSIPSLGVEGLQAGNLVQAEDPLTTLAPVLDASLLTTGRETPSSESSGNCGARECPTMDKLPVDTRMESVVSADSGHANDSRLPVNLSFQIKEGNRSNSAKCDSNSSNSFVYMGCSFKHRSYINNYMHGDFAASAAAKLAILFSEEFRSESYGSDNQGKVISANLQAKAFSFTASRFFWPSSEKKLVEVPRERCGWCLSCKAPVSSKKGCMLNHAALSATKSAMKILSGLSPIRSGEGILPSIVTYIIYMEDSLRGVIVGPFLSASYRKQWRNCVEQATTLSALKPLLLELEQNIRMLAFFEDWTKLTDDWLAESYMIQSAACSVGTTQKLAPSGRRYKKHSAFGELRAYGCRNNNFSWWQGGKLTKFIFLKAVLPKSMARKAARQGGLRKITGVVYTDGPEIPKRSRQLVWRAAVQMSRNASQLALQVRYLDFHLRWCDLIRPEQNLQSGKGQETEAFAFRNASICDRKLVEGKICYGIAFGSQKHLPSCVLKNVFEVEQGPEGTAKYWFMEACIPLYLVKEYEKFKGIVPSDKEHLNAAPQLCSRLVKASSKDIFFYLTCKRDKLNIFSCSICQLGVSVRYASQCSTCKAYCHEACSINSVSADKEAKFITTCKQCYHSTLQTQKETSNKSPISPFLLQGREPSFPVVLEGQRPKRYDQTSNRMKDTGPDLKQGASNSSLATKSRRSSSWGIIWKKKSSEDTGFDFRLKNILLKGRSGVPQLEPVCRLCHKPYRSDLMYICCETCKYWYHAEALELQESKFLDVLGFKCCKCRRIKSPVCPYSDSKNHMQEGKKTLISASKKEHSGTYSKLKDCKPATNDPLLPHPSVELIAEPKLEKNIEMNAVSGLGPNNLQVKRIVRGESDDCGSFETKISHQEISRHDETSILFKPAEKAPPVEYDSAILLDSNLLNDCGNVRNGNTGFEHHDGNQIQRSETHGNLPKYLENSCTLKVVPERGAVSLVDKSEPKSSIQCSAYCCRQCLRNEPAPDLTCEICELRIHRECSIWNESPPCLGNWRCGSCREWR